MLSRRIQSDRLDDVRVEPGHECLGPVIATHGEGVPEAVLLAQPEKLALAGKPIHATNDLDPGIVSILQKLLHLTRRLAALSLKKEDYRLRFGGDPQEDFGDELALLIEKRLLEDQGETIVPTPRGMFYADSIAGLLAEDHLRVRRRLLMPADGDDLDDPDNDNSEWHM